MLSDKTYKSYEKNQDLYAVGYLEYFYKKLPKLKTNLASQIKIKEEKIESNKWKLTTPKTALIIISFLQLIAIIFLSGLYYFNSITISEQNDIIADNEYTIQYLQSRLTYRVSQVTELQDELDSIESAYEFFDEYAKNSIY